MIYSQSSLQDYVDCARRFELRYMQRLRWPAVQSEPLMEHEALMQRGVDFHRMVQQHVVGIPAEVIGRAAMDDDLRRWWQAYLNSEYAHVPDRRAEVTLQVPLAGSRLVAQYDLLVRQGVIVDWKTATRRTPREILADRLQTLVYPYVLVEAGGYTPEQVTMVYWFANFPDEPERFTYDTDQHRQAGARLQALITEIDERQVFDLTTDTRRCDFCVYRSYCERGIAAGQMDADGEIEIAEDFAFDFDQIAEVEF